MNDKDKEIIDLLKVWHFLKTGNFIWPAALKALEDRLNELLGQDPENWKQTRLGPTKA